MANEYLISNLITSLRDRCQLPSTDETYSSARLIQFINDELRLYVTRMIMATREEFFVADYDTSIVSGTASYRMPPRAIGTKLRRVSLVDSNGNITELPRIEPEHQGEYSVNGSLQGYMLKGSNVVLVPTPVTTSGTLRQTYFQRPNKIVPSDEVGEITAINTGTKQVTISATPGDFTTSLTYDFVRGTPNFENLAIDQACTLISSNVITFTSTLPTGLAVGDYVCVAGESPIPQIPVELHAFLAQRGAVKAMEGLGDPKVAFAKGILDEMRQDATSLLTPRVEGSSRKLINYNAPGWNSRRHNH